MKRILNKMAGLAAGLALMIPIGGGLTLSAVADETQGTVATAANRAVTFRDTSQSPQIISQDGDYVVIGPTSNRIVVSSNVTATITLTNVAITGMESNSNNGAPATSAIDLSPGATLTLILHDNTSNSLTGGIGTMGGAPGIHVPLGSTLIIQGNGSLSVIGGSSDSGYGGTGIGGAVGQSVTGYKPGESCGTVVILSRNISVVGGSGHGGDIVASIGGGEGTKQGDNGTGIKPVPNTDNTYEVWGELTLPEGVTIPEDAVLTGSGSLDENFRLEQSAPSKPSTNGITPTTVTLNTIASGHGAPQYGYITGSQSTDTITWEDSPVFEGLFPNTTYTFYARHAGDNKFYKASPVSEGLTVTTPRQQLAAPNSVTLVSNTSSKVTAAWEAVTNASGYSVQLHKDGKAQGSAIDVTSGTSHEFDITEAGGYTIKVKATGSGNYADSQEAESGSLTFHAVNFDTNGGDNAPAVQIIAQGNTVTKPADPVKDGYTFDGWRTAQTGGEQWDFNRGVTGSMTLWAHWTQDTPTPPTPTPSPSPTYQGIRVTSKPDKTEYEVGEELDLTGLVVREHWSDGSSRTLDASEYTVSGFDSHEPGEKTVTITLKRDTSRTATFTVTVAAASVTVHRLYNTLTGEHLYTANTTERDHLAANGWRYEGSAFTMSSHGTPVHRYYDPRSRLHMFTASQAERDALAASGWRYEGIAWHTPDAGGTPVHRLYNKANGDHLHTTDQAEYDTLKTHGWRDEGISFTTY